MPVKDSPDEENEEMTPVAATTNNRGLIVDRFSGGKIVIHAKTKVKSAGRELQLPSMSLLTNKAASQHFFLRILKVIIQLRDAARLSTKKARRGGN